MCHLVSWSHTGSVPSLLLKKTVSPNLFKYVCSGTIIAREIFQVQKDSLGILSYIVNLEKQSTFLCFKLSLNF